MSEKPLNPQQARLLRAFKNVASTEDGQLVFQEIMRRCGFKESSLVYVADTGEILVHSTAYNEARRNVYLELRRLLPTNVLNNIEQEVERVESEPEEVK